MIVLENVQKSFGNHQVLKDISLTIRDGTTRVILGGSGSGKTVLMKHIIGLFKPDAGKIEIDGTDITSLDDKELLEVRRKFGMVFQQSALFDSMSVRDNVAFPLREHRELTENEIETKVMEKLTLVGLEKAVDKFPSELSGGMRKRVALARAVVLDPTYILYDEPTTGLDPITTENVDHMIMDAQKRLHVTSVVISHDVGSALRVADDIAVIHEGTIIEDCPASEIRNSKHPFVQRFLNIWFEKA